MSSRRARWAFTAFVWLVAVAVIAAQAVGWLAPRVQVWQFATAVAVIAAATTLSAWLWE